MASSTAAWSRWNWSTSGGQIRGLRSGHGQPLSAQLSGYEAHVVDSSLDHPLETANRVLDRVKAGAIRLEAG